MVRSPSRFPRNLLLAGALLGLTLFAAGPVLATPHPGGEASEQFEKAYDLAGIDKVRVQNVNGPVHVVSWDRDYLRVTAVKRAKGSRAEECLKETEIRVTKSGHAIEIETIPPKRHGTFNFFFWNRSSAAEVTYDILMPPGVAIDVETVNGKVTAERRTGSVALSTVNGSVRVDGQDGPLKVSTVNGSVEATFVGPMKSADFETVNGSVTVSCAKDSSIRYNLQTVNGRIQSEFADLSVEGKWGPKEARGAINGGRERLAVETVNGEVRLLASSVPK